MNKMISRRKFVSMTMMMVVLLFMFQFTQVIKDMDNQYNHNEYTAESFTNKDSAWKMSAVTQDNPMADESYVVYLGDEKDDIRHTVFQWCIYTKRELKENMTLEQVLAESSKVEVLLVNSANVDFDKDTPKLIKLVGRGVPVIFCNLPDTEVIKKSKELRSLLGIKSVEADEVELQGIKLFSGFLLGGETIYEVKDSLDVARQDLELKIPYYIAFGGTKTYMVGMLEEDSVENEYLPAIIWRNGSGNAMVFAVNGEYMADSTGVGILDAMMCELYDYEIYPIVNAQNLTIANYPGFAEENIEEIRRIYSRTPSGLYRDIMWPGIAATTGSNMLNETLFFMAQSDYADGNEPVSSDYVFYLKEIKEHGAEAGVSLNINSDIGLEEKIDLDTSFYEEANDGYVFTAGYVGSADEKIELISKQLLDKDLLKDMKTIVQKYENGTDIVSYATRDVTLLSTTSDGFHYTFSQDLRMRSLQTALGYSNILLDMYVLAWPTDTKDTWENLYDAFSRNVNTFWKPFKVFDNTTISETDTRVRSMLGLDYSDSRENNVISLHVDNLQEEAWFMLKVNDSSVKKVVGAEVKEIEDSAYLLRVTTENVTIYLKADNEPYYYIPK